MKSEIIAVGSEMLTPFRQDTNSLHLTERLNEIGVLVAFKTIVGDRRKDLAGAIRTALGRVDIVLIMGGLGPTEDDLTREATADALSINLRRDASQVAALHARAASWRISMPQNNLKQAEVLQGATLLQNPNGSAPGQWLDTTFEGYRKLIALLPGPPHECNPLFDTEVLPRLREIVPPRAIATRTLKAAMIPESQADKILAPIYTTYTDVETTLLAHAGDLQITLICSKANITAAQERVDDLAERLEEALEDWLYSSQGDTLEQIVLYYLGLRQATLAVAESCTGGLIAERITSVPGASRAFIGGVVVYSDKLKIEMAGVPAELIEQHGAVSAEVAQALADGIRERTGATIGVGVTGIAGPTGATEKKPVGLVYIAVTDGQTTDAVERTFRGDRNRIREWASTQALDMLRKRLM
jgi:nicotinamide-nucleotide amidase